MNALLMDNIPAIASLVDGEALPELPTVKTLLSILQYQNFIFLPTSDKHFVVNFCFCGYSTRFEPNLQNHASLLFRESDTNTIKQN
jgi:hypothetical protein